MRCPICKQGKGSDRWSQESLDKHMASFHHRDVVAASEANARGSFVEAIDSMLLEADQREASEVLQTIPLEEREHAEAVEVVRRLGLKPMTLSSKLCWSWLATVLLVGLTLVALVLVTKV